MRRAVTEKVDPAGSSVRSAAEAHRDVRGLRRARGAGAGRRRSSAVPARASRCTRAGPTRSLPAPPSTSRRPWPARRDGPSTAACVGRAVVWGCVASPGPSRSSGPPKRQAAITSAVTTAIATSASTAMRDSRSGRSRSRRRHPPRADDDDVVLAHREAGVVLVDERLAVEAERIGVRAEEAAHVRRRGQDVEAARPRAPAGTSAGSSSAARARGSRAPGGRGPRAGWSRCRTRAG